MSSHKFAVKKYASLLALASCCLAGTAYAADPAAVNVSRTYIMDGKVVSGWGLQLGDPENWGTGITGQTGKSASTKVTVEPSDHLAQGDALKFTWAPRKKMTGVVALYGSSIDLSPLENKAALVFDLKMDVMPDMPVTMTMDCGYPCKGEVQMRKTLADVKKNEWTTFPIPLNCFSLQGADLKKINGPIKLSTDGKMTIEIANARIMMLADGDKGCAK